MAELHGGHVVAKYLKEVEEVGAVFSLSGGHIDRIYDGFHEYGVKLIDVRHEQAAVHAVGDRVLLTRQHHQPLVILQTAARFP